MITLYLNGPLDIRSTYSRQYTLLNMLYSVCAPEHSLERICREILMNRVTQM